MVFSRFLILNRAFSHFMYLRKFKFRKRGGTSPQNVKTKLVHCCDVVPNLVVEIVIFNFCLFVCLFTCLFVPRVLPISQEENGPIINAIV